MSLRHSTGLVLGTALLASLAVVVLLSEDAEATHFWSGSLSWDRVLPEEASSLIGADAAVRITGYLSFDSTPAQFSSGGAGCNKVVGTVISSDKANFANLYVDGVPVEYVMKVKYADQFMAPTGHCRFAAAIQDPSQLGTEMGVLVPIPPVGPPIEVWWGNAPDLGGVSADFCCRETIDHINNPGRRAYMGTVLVPGDPNSSPVIDFPSITTLTSHGAYGYGNHHCPQNAFCKFYIKASDPDNDTLTWRLATTDEAGPGFSHPPAFSVNKNTGLVTWDTSSAIKDKLYSTQIIVEDGITKVPVDFMVEIGPGCENGAKGVVDPVTGELICVFEPEPPEPSAPCEVNPDGDGCRPVPPKPSKGQGYAHKFWPPGRHVVPLEPTVSGSEPVFSSQNDDVDASLSGLDSDGDSIDDSLDQCHGVESVGIDTDGDGQDDACDEDDDNDGILDEMDACRTDADTFCGLEQEGKDPTEQEQDASRGFFSPAEAVEPGSGSAAVQGIEAASGVFATAFLGLLAAAFILLLVVGRRRRS